MRGRVHIGQLIVAELALGASAAAWIGPAWVFAGVTTCAIGVLVAVFGRTGGRWWYQAVAGHRRFVRRRRRAATEVVGAALAGRRDPPPLVWLRTLAPGLTVRAVDFSGEIVGVALDRNGWFAAVEADGAALLGADEVVPLLDRLSTAQLIVCPDGRLGWLAVRLSPVDAAEAERRGAERAVRIAVAEGAIRAARLLRGRGLVARVLDPSGLLSALVQASGLDGPPQEHWASWRSGTLAHACYEATWPDALPLVAPGVTLSATYGPDSSHILVRVAAPPVELGRACRRAERAAEAAGIQLRRLDGDHAVAAYACAPTAVPALPR